ncbi:MAG: NAD-dependent epimerase/dehydratase family protein [Candidatus Latescibacteria bacterium]|nr:NAD-dependent epimerase/dehydratase family protein [Candidatus Latescibacterota bacterium]
MSYLVTGVAGFIGFHIAERFLSQGQPVTGIDCFLDSYPRPIKEDRVQRLREYSLFRFVEQSLIEANLEALLDGISAVFHEAGQAGVRPSWGTNFHIYVENNILATQRLLEAVTHARVRRFLYASSSSVYGNAPELPIRETSPTQPISPYGVTKLAAEHLCSLYWKNLGLPVVSLRYFTVFGPRPRPDMAITIFAKAILAGEEMVVFGDGEQSRGFTYVDDVVDANVRAAERDVSGQVFNIGGGGRITVNALIHLLEEIIGKRAIVRHTESQKGDALHTEADTSRAYQALGYQPATDMREGLAKTVASIREFYKL